MQPDTFGIVSYEILLDLFDRKGTIRLYTTLVRQSGALWVLIYRCASLVRSAFVSRFNLGILPTSSEQPFVGITFREIDPFG